MEPADPKKLTEAEIAKVAEIFFTQKGWELFPEVVIPIFGGRPDLMGRKQTLCMALETKTSLSYPVLEQLTRWHRDMQEAKASPYRDENAYGIPHLLVAVAARGKNSINGLKKDIMAQYRIGYYEVSYEGSSWRKDNRAFDDHGYGHLEGHRWRVHEVLPAKIQPGSRQTAHKIFDHLKDDMKMGTAGVTGQKDSYMTPFKRTLNKAVKVLEQHGECHIAHIVEVINAKHGGHHYSNDASAKQGISKFLLEFELAIKPDERIPIYRLAGLPEAEALARKKKGKAQLNLL